MRRCKCKICGTESTTDKAFKVTTHEKNSYYCTEEEYNQQQEENNQKKKCMELVYGYTHTYAPCYTKEFSRIRQQYEWRVIIAALKECEKTIIWFMSNNKMATDFAKARYMTTCILNVANKCKFKLQKEDEFKANLFKEDKVMDIDIMNIDIEPVRHEVNDISEFL